MDCGPACLKSLLEGHGVSASYGRLREACHTDVDGTSIDALERVAGDLGLDARQVMVPLDHLLLAESALLPALVVTRQPSGTTHFVVVWSARAGVVQVMDPAIGRHYSTRREFVDEVHVHEMAIPLAAWCEWAASDDFLSALRRRIADLGVSRSQTERWIGAPAPSDSWRRLAALDAAPFVAAEFRDLIDQNLALAAESGSSTTWVFSNHDVIRHATRYGLPVPAGRTPRQVGGAWLLSGGVTPPVDAALGLRRARAATLLQLALPGSAYLYQGEELGLPEVADIPAEQRQDPAFFRNPGVDIGRDGCRVPLPWTRSGPSFGFGSAGAHLPQPAWFGDLSVEAQEGDPESTLTLYRRALSLRRSLQTEEALSWLESGEEVLAFERPGGWISITNFGSEPVTLPEGEVLIASGPLGEDLPGATTAWLRR
jgi:alpha-glucosidase